MGFAVSTKRNADTASCMAARQWANELGVPYIERQRKGTLEEMLAAHQLDAILLATAQGPQIFTTSGVFFYHPGMAVLRLKQLKRGVKDNFAEAMELKSGMRILDCTLGLAGDASIASYIAGSSGRVVGLEASRLLSFAVQYGLRRYEAEDSDLTDALRRIESINIEAEHYLANCGPDSFDAVYFDPMFRWPVTSSKVMESLRPIAYDKPLTMQAVQLALKAAPKVVIKERSEKILRSYGCTEITGGRYSRVKYGIIRRQTGEE